MCVKCLLAELIYIPKTVSKKAKNLWDGYESIHLNCHYKSMTGESCIQMHVTIK